MNMSTLAEDWDKLRSSIKDGLFNYTIPDYAEDRLNDPEFDFKKPIRIGVIGDPFLNQYRNVVRSVATFLNFFGVSNFIIVTGDRNGAERTVIKACETNNIQCAVLKYRDEETDNQLDRRILERSDVVLILEHAKSTRDFSKTIKKARDCGLVVEKRILRKP